MLKLFGGFDVYLFIRGFGRSKWRVARCYTLGVVEQSPHFLLVVLSCSMSLIADTELFSFLKS